MQECDCGAAQTFSPVPNTACTLCVLTTLYTYMEQETLESLHMGQIEEAEAQVCAIPIPGLFYYFLSNQL